MVPDPAKTSLGLEYFCSEGDALWTHARRRADRARQGGARAHRARARGGDRGRLRVPRAQGVSGLRRHVPGAPRHRPASSWTASRISRPSAATGCTATTTRTTRCSPACSPSATSPAASGTTSGASTPSRSTTRRWESTEDGGGGPRGPDHGDLPPSRRRRAGRRHRPGGGRAPLPGDPDPGPQGRSGRRAPPGAARPVPSRLHRHGPRGAALGLAYGVVGGFVAGWSFATLRNLTLFFSLAFVRRRAQRQLLKRFLEFV